MIVNVNYDGKEVGIVAQDNAGNYAFRYNPNFLNSGIQLSPILMPLENRTFIFNDRAWNPETFKFLPPMLADSLPDDFGNRLMRQWLIERNLNPDNINSLERLSYVGKRGMGALEFIPDLNLDTPNNNIYLEDLVDLVNDIIAEKHETKVSYSDYESNLNTMLRIGSSVGGARAKALIAINKENGTVKAGDILQQDGEYEYYLIKFDGIVDGKETGHKEYCLIEYLYSKMAKSCSIDIPETKIIEQGDLKHFLIKRFDRVNNQKLHQQTLCGMIGADFRTPGVYSYEQFFQTLDVLNLPESDVEQLYRRMVFNVLFVNNDDHTKNFSFLMKDNKWHLSPAYDITFAYNSENKWLKQSNMSINGKTKDYRFEDFEILAERFNIYNYKYIISEVHEKLSELPSMAKKVGVSYKNFSHIHSLISSSKIVSEISDVLNKKKYKKL